MAVGKEILTKIRSVQNTQKITKAMQMVSTSKMRKTQERMRLARPYAEKVRLVMSHLAQTHSDHGIKLLEPHRSVRRAGFILMTTDKGLCGGLNANVLKKFLAQVQEYRSQGIEVDVVCLGSKGLAACQRIVEGTQLMTVYKPVERLAREAAELVVSMVMGKKPIVTDTIYDGKYNVPYEKLSPIMVTRENIDEVIIEGGFHRREQVYLNLD